MKRALMLLAVLGLFACAEKKRAMPPAGPNAQEVTIETTPPGAQVAIDGVLIGQTPLKLKIDPGRYRVRFSMSAYFPEEQVLTVPYGEAVKFSHSLIRSH